MRRRNFLIGFTFQYAINKMCYSGIVDIVFVCDFMTTSNVFICKVDLIWTTGLESHGVIV